MTKAKAKKLVLDRAPTTYKKSVVTLLCKLLDITFIPDYRNDHVENFYSAPLSVSKLAFLTNLHWNTVSAALKELKHDGVITGGRMTDSYRVNPEILKMLPSKFKSATMKELERKILKAVRMKLSRRVELKALPWAYEHPAEVDGALTCVCVPSFCAHPSVV
jgi:DNA-binding transcriptional regulator YhcF (GntR family)